MAAQNRLGYPFLIGHPRQRGHRSMHPVDARHESCHRDLLAGTGRHQMHRMHSSLLADSI